MKKKILIVGGTGFLGYHLAKKCLSKKWEVSSISINRPKKIRYLKKFKPYSCDSSTWNNVGRYGWLYIYMGNGVMKQINRDCIRLNPNQKIKEKLKLMGINLKKLKSTEGWTGSNNEAMKTGAASWVSYSIDAEKNLGTKLFLACGNLDNIKIVCDAYIKLMELKK